MKRLLSASLVLAALVFCCAGTAFACFLQGYVHCEGNGQPMAGVQIDVVSNSFDPAFTASSTTDANGFYGPIAVPASPATYHMTVVLGPNQHVVVPAAGSYEFSIQGNENEIVNDWVLYDPACLPPQGRCWLTGGGARVEAGTGHWHSFGGNVNPGCSATAGDGGNWNDIDHTASLHFQGKAIEVLDCGNIPGIPPGSSSPETPFNFIEFKGTGTLKGINGNHEDFGGVFFWGHYEDRGEPGTEDRYFLRVYSNQADPVGSTLMLVDADGNAATMDPVQIDNGNLQLHITGCAKNGAPRFGSSQLQDDPSNAQSPAGTVVPATWGKLKIVYR